MDTNRNLEQYKAKGNLYLVDALKCIEKNTRGILFLTDEEDRVCGSLSDGDIRRWIITTGELNTRIEKIAYKQTRCLNAVKANQAQELMRKYGFTAVPIIDDNRRLIDIIFSDGSKVQYHKDALKNTPVIIMAGGIGSRLYPYTKILPKPLIPIGDVPIIERIMDKFSIYGVENFYLIVNYKKEMIRSYFLDRKKSYQINYIDEDVPRGTAGGIFLIRDQFERDVIVTNCDILINEEYDKILSFHKKSGNAMTIVSSLKNTTLPYGVIKTGEEGRVSAIEEKPRFTNLINTGMYIVNAKCFRLIPPNGIYHMTDLARELIFGNNKVGIYPVSEELFLDMGEFEEMKRMEEVIGKNI